MDAAPSSPPRAAQALVAAPVAADVELDGISPPRWADRAVLAAVLLVAAAAAYALWADLHLIYDGSYQLARTIRDGRPFVYLSRFHTEALWWPAAWLSWRTDDVRVLSAAYGAPFMFAPVAGLALSWWVVRRHRPGLIVWAALGILGTPLPGQVFVINDSLFQQHVFWPVFLGLLVPATGWQKLVLAGLAVFQLAHPVGFVLMGGAAGTAVAAAWATRDRRERRRLLHEAVFAGAFAAAAGWKLWWVGQPGTPYYDAYLAQEASWATAMARWHAAVEGPPIRAVKWLWVVAAAALAHGWLARSGPTPYLERPRAARVAAVGLALLAVVGVGAAGFVLTYWSNWPHIWWGAVDYRRWLVPLTAPVFACAAIEAVWAARRAPASPLTPPRGLALRATLLPMLAAMFAVVVGNQARHYKALTDRVYAELMSGPDAAMELPPGHAARETPVHHWSMGWHMLLLQGKRPTRLLVPTQFTDEPGFRQQAHAGLEAAVPKLPVHVDADGYGLIEAGPGPTGWFDFRELLPRVVAQNRASGVPRRLPNQPGVATTTPASRPAAEVP